MRIPAPKSWHDSISGLQRWGAISPRTASIVVGFIFLTTAIEGLGISMLLPLLTIIEQGGGAAMAPTDEFALGWLTAGFEALEIPINLTAVSSVLFLIVLLRQGAQYASAVYIAKVRFGLENTFRQRLFEHALQATWWQIAKHGTGSIVEFLTVQCRQASLLVESFARLTKTTLLFITYGVLAIIAAPVLSVGVAITILTGLVLVNRHITHTRQLSNENVAAQKDYSQSVSERYRGWRLVKLSDAGIREQALHGGKSKRLADLNIDIVRIGARMEAILFPSVTGLLLLMLYFTITYGEASLSVMTLFVVIFMRLMPVSLSFQRDRLAIERLAASIRRVSDMLEGFTQAVEIDQGQLDCRGVTSEVRLSGVSYMYPSRDEGALHDVSLTIPAGKLTALIGPSGAGKSTLVDMLPRLIEPDTGLVSIDGTPVSEFRLSTLRRNIAFMPQEPIIFDESVESNVSYGRPEASHKEIISACRLAHADRFIDTLPDGYKTFLGESGQSLSGGQKQRIAFARAIASGAGIIVLDEPTSALDQETEHYIHHTLKELKATGAFTLIVIAHHSATFELADHVIELDNGRVVYEGIYNGSSAGQASTFA